MPESWWEKRVDLEIEQLRSEIRALQNLMLRGALALCVFVQIIGMLVLAISGGR